MAEQQHTLTLESDRANKTIPLVYDNYVLPLKTLKMHNILSIEHCAQYDPCSMQRKKTGMLLLI